jgi:hypothetical protein
VATRCTISFVGAQQPIDLQLYIDGVSLALIWSNPVRFKCPRCNADHEARVGTAHLEPLYSNLIKRSLKSLTLQPPEDALSARAVSTRAVVAAMRTLSVTCLRDPSNPHGAGAFRLSIRSVAPLLEVGKLSAIEVKHEKPKDG